MWRDVVRIHLSLSCLFPLSVSLRLSLSLSPPASPVANDAGYGSPSLSHSIFAVVFYWGNIGIMENQMETTIVYWGFIGIMEKKMEATIV